MYVDKLTMVVADDCICYWKVIVFLNREVQLYRKATFLIVSASFPCNNLMFQLERGIIPLSVEPHSAFSSQPLSSRIAGHQERLYEHHRLVDLPMSHSDHCCHNGNTTSEYSPPRPDLPQTIQSACIHQTHSMPLPRTHSTHPNTHTLYPAPLISLCYDQTLHLFTRAYARTSRHFRSSTDPPHSHDPSESKSHAEIEHVD